MKTILKLGCMASILAFSFTLAYCIIQLLQIQRVIKYPHDEILIYGSSLLIVVPFIVAMATLHVITAPGKKYWTLLAIIFTTLYAAFVIANYVVQLATVIPMKLKDHGNEISILEQTPHSVFWDFDAVGYIFMGIAMLFALPAFNKSKQHKLIRLSFLANGLVTPLIAVVYFYPVYSEKLLILGYPWAVTAPLAMLSLAVFFHQKSRSEMNRTVVC